MGPKPTHLRLDEDDGLPRPPTFPFAMDLPSPRAGEIPPALSPLDAFAMHSRALARQFEEEQKNGRRLSRLSPVIVQKELANRPDYFRSISGSTDGGVALNELAEVREEASPTSLKHGLLISDGAGYERPRSIYPMFGHANKPSLGQDPPLPAHGFFGMPRASSPEPVDPKLNVEAPLPMPPSLTNSVDSVQSTQPRTLTNGSTRSQRSLRSEGGLLAPQSPKYPKSPRSFQSIRSVPPDSDDDGSFHSAPRKFSSGSAMSSRPHSPFFPPARDIRSPSVTSQASASRSIMPQHKAAASRNFSRPMSSGGASITLSQGTRPSLESRPSPRTSAELPHRNISNSTHPSTVSSNISRQASQDDVCVPYAQEPSELLSSRPSPSDRFPSGRETPTGGPSDSAANLPLPRGRAVERNSIGLAASWELHQFSWDTERSAVTPPTTTEDEHKPINREDCSNSNISQPARPASPPLKPSSPVVRTSSPNISGARLSRHDLGASHKSAGLRSHSANPDGRGRSPLHQSTPSVRTESTDRTIRATPLHERSPSAELSPEEHLEVGIQAHSAGALQKSTYHLRLAANAGLPTAMLLYALACRHGWGMRPNQPEGVKWLRKAIDGSGLDMVDVDNTLSSTQPKLDPMERRKRKAQFALAIYELGISYMNGWGCQKDKPLAVRCYEVAGSWGDADALAEAGYCYTQGQGCKKDLKKAAGLYRQAAELGMEMAGNSWIYKEKYMDDAARPATALDIKDVRRTDTGDSGGKRSRARSIWGRKKDKS